MPPDSASAKLPIKSIRLPKRSLFICCWIILGLAAALALLYFPGVPLSQAAPPADVSARPLQQGPSCPLDVAVVFDISGSMDYESNCYGCWVKNPIKSDIMAFPYPTNGDYRPLTSAILSGSLCTATPTAIISGSTEVLAHEAELYSRIGPLPSPWDFENHLPGSSRWVLQRVAGTGAAEDAYIRSHPFTTYNQSYIGNFPILQGMSYNDECFTVGQCWKTRGDALGEVAPNEVPYVEYDFTPPWSGATNIWARVQGGWSATGYAVEWNGSTPQDNPSAYRYLTQYEKAIFWQVSTQAVQGGTYSNIVAGDRGDQDSDPLSNSEWRWLKLGSATTTQNVQATLRLYQGSSGFSVDKILLTNDSTGSTGVAVQNDGTGLASGDLRMLLTQNSGQGPAATAGSATREACNQCNPEFGLTIGPGSCSCKMTPADTAVSGSYQGGGSGQGCTNVLTTLNNLNNDLFADQVFIRNAQEAVKHLAQQLDPRFDQLGFVVFDSSVRSDSANRAKLQCLRWAETNDPNGLTQCYDPSTDPISYTQIFQGIENQNNNGGSNIAEGLCEGLEELGISIEPYNSDTVTHECSSSSDDGKACDRGGAARKTLLLITDGAPNSTSSSMCGSDIKWRGKVGTNTAPYNCSIWFAAQAANNNIPLYIIGLGPGASKDLLAAMATGTDPNPVSGDDGYYFAGQGQFFAVSDLTDLNAAVESILAQMRSCQISPQIASTSGYTVSTTQPLTIHLENHSPAAGPYDIYLNDNAGGAYRICTNVPTDALSRTAPDPACDLSSIPAGLYDLYSTVAGTINPRLAAASQQVEILSGGSSSASPIYLPVIVKNK